MSSVSERRYSDAAHRCSDLIRAHILAGNAGRWVAVRLSDGGSDGVVYDRRADAVRHQLHEQQCAYVRVPLDDMSPAAAESFLGMHRRIYDAGYRLVDPDAGDRELMVPMAREERRAALGMLLRGRA